MWECAEALRVILVEQERETQSSEHLLIQTRPDWAKPDQRAHTAVE